MKWIKLRRETTLLEFVCEHGVGHPAYGSALWLAEHLDMDLSTWLTHGCDGCCGREDFPGTCHNSLVKAHEIIRGLNRLLNDYNQNRDNDGE